MRSPTSHDESPFFRMPESQSCITAAVAAFLCDFDDSWLMRGTRSSGDSLSSLDVLWAIVFARVMWYPDESQGLSHFPVKGNGKSAGPPQLSINLRSAYCCVEDVVTLPAIVDEKGTGCTFRILLSDSGSHCIRLVTARSSWNSVDAHELVFLGSPGAIGFYSAPPENYLAAPGVDKTHDDVVRDTLRAYRCNRPRGMVLRGGVLYWVDSGNCIVRWTDTSSGRGGALAGSPSSRRGCVPGTLSTCSFSPDASLLSAPDADCWERHAERQWLALADGPHILIVQPSFDQVKKVHSASAPISSLVVAPTGTDIVFRSSSSPLNIAEIVAVGSDSSGGGYSSRRRVQIGGEVLRGPTALAEAACGLWLAVQPFATPFKVTRNEAGVAAIPTLGLYSGRPSQQMHLVCPPRPPPQTFRDLDPRTPIPAKTAPNTLH